jgi:uncharacterized Zn finger protein
LYYQLGDRFSEDPFVLFQLRGRTKEQIISDLRRLRSAKIQPNTTETPDIQQSIPKNKYSVKIDSFWQYNEPLESSLVVIAPSTSEMVLDVLGAIPLAKEEENAVNSTSSDVVMKYLNTVYRDVSQKAFLTAMNVGGS